MNFQSREDEFGTIWHSLSGGGWQAVSYLKYDLPHHCIDCHDVECPECGCPFAHDNNACGDPACCGELSLFCMNCDYVFY